MSLSSRLSATALRLLTEYGQTISVSRYAGTFVPSDGTMSSTSTTTYSGYGYPSQYTKMDLDNLTVLASDTLLIFSSSTTPQVNDVFTVGTKSMTALNIQDITVSGSNVVYKIQLRQ